MICFHFVKRMGKRWGIENGSWIANEVTQDEHRLEYLLRKNG